MRFNSLLNKFLVEHNSTPIEGISYQQYFIVEKKGYYYIFNEFNNKIIGSSKTIKEAKERVDSIVSGC